MPHFFYTCSILKIWHVLHLSNITRRRAIAIFTGKSKFNECILLNSCRFSQIGSYKRNNIKCYNSYKSAVKSKRKQQTLLYFCRSVVKIRWFSLQCNFKYWIWELSVRFWNSNYSLKLLFKVFGIQKVSLLIPFSHLSDFHLCRIPLCLSFFTIQVIWMAASHITECHVLFFRMTLTVLLNYFSCSKLKNFNVEIYSFPKKSWNEYFSKGHTFHKTFHFACFYRVIWVIHVINFILNVSFFYLVYLLKTL